MSAGQEGFLAESGGQEKNLGRRWKASAQMRRTEVEEISGEEDDGSS